MSANDPKRTWAGTVLEYLRGNIPSRLTARAVAGPLTAKEITGRKPCYECVACGRLQRLPLSWLAPHPASAQTIIDQWQSIQAPPAPTLKAVTANPKTTALLVMDIIKQFCNDQDRPRCVASIPKIATLLDAARASGVTIIYTVVPSLGPNAPAPVAADIILQSRPRLMTSL